MASQTKYHLFSLPPELLDTLVPRNLFDEPVPPTEPEATSNATSADSSSRSCNTCLGATFTDVEQQRAHFRSDWHRYNVNTRLNGGNPVSETEYARLAEEPESASDSDDSYSGESGSDSEERVASLVKRKHAERPEPEYDDPVKAPRTALAWFHSPPSTQIGVYRSVFPIDIPESNFLAALRDMQISVETGRTWAMFMVAGGHFAGAIIRVSDAEADEDDASAQKRKKYKQPKPETEVLKHKTFHRYTTRRKQGGSQSLNDNAKGNAKSAGALLRRYGEQALRDDIRNLIRDWAEDLEGCERIWIRASRSNRKIFMDYDGCSITKADDRLRTFPFPTKRPTQAEMSRCRLELTQVKVTHFSEDELRAQDEAFLASLPKPKQPSVPSAPTPVEKAKAPQLTKEEEVLREEWERLLDMITKGRLDALKSFWEREGTDLGGVNVQIPEWTDEKGKTTLLQMAAHAGQEDVTRWLLEDCHADPTIQALSRGSKDSNGEEASRSQVAYDFARTKSVRDVFRRCAGEHPDWWDWFGAGHVPSALSKDMEEEREEKKKVRRKGLKERVKEREAKEKEKSREATPSPPPLPVVPEPTNLTGPRRLGGASGATEGITGLTPEMRAKVERERRARAAEARLKALGGR